MWIQWVLCWAHNQGMPAALVLDCRVCCIMPCQIPDPCAPAVRSPPNRLGGYSRMMSKRALKSDLSKFTSLMRVFPEQSHSKGMPILRAITGKLVVIMITPQGDPSNYLEA